MPRALNPINTVVSLMQTVNLRMWIIGFENLRMWIMEFCSVNAFSVKWATEFNFWNVVIMFGS